MSIHSGIYQVINKKTVYDSGANRDNEEHFFPQKERFKFRMTKNGDKTMSVL